MTKIVLTSIENTVSSSAYLHDVLLPYASDRLADYLHMNYSKPAVKQALASAAELINSTGNDIEANDIDAMAAALLNWMDINKQAAPLQELQTMIWQEGYASGALKAHFYPDAGRVMLQWYIRSIPFYVYSNMSVAAQRLLFGYNEAGNLLPLFHGFFDAQLGNKKEASSYLNILAKLQQAHDVQATDVLFLSDNLEELDAAKEAGMQTYWLVREGELPQDARHPVARSFAEIKRS